MWRELNDKAETLREELDSVEGEAVNSIREALSKEALANLMNNRPIASQQRYNKNIDVYNRYRNEVDNGIIQKVSQRLGREYTLEELERDRAEIARKNSANPRIPLTDQEGVVYYEDLMSTHELKIANDVKRMELNDKTSFLELLNKGRESEAEFKEVCNNLYNTILKELGLKKEDLSITLRDGLKGNYRIVDKTVNDYGGDFSRIFDVNGGTLTFKTIKESSQGWEIAKKYLGDKVANEKATATNFGYKDFKINLRMDNGFVGEMIFLDEDTMWAKEKGLGHDIYEVAREALEKIVAPEKKENIQKYRALFGEKVYTKMNSLYNALAEWSTKYYENSHDIRFGQYDMDGFNVNFRAVSSEITGLVDQLRENFPNSVSDGSSSYTLPSEVDLNTNKSPVDMFLLNAVSQISKYLNAIKKASDTSNVTQGETEVKQTSDSTGVRYNKTVYHGSNALFSSFDRRFALEGSGGQDYGAGVYTTERIGIAKDYAQKAQFKDADVESWIADMPQEINKSKEEISSLNKSIENFKNFITSVKQNNPNAIGLLNLRYALYDTERLKLNEEKSIALSRVEIASQTNDALKYRNVRASSYVESLFSTKESEIERELNNVRLEAYRSIIESINNGEVESYEGFSVEETLQNEYGDDLFAPYFMNIAEKARDNWNGKQDSTSLLSTAEFKTEDEYVLGCIKVELEKSIEGVQNYINLLTESINEPSLDKEEVYKMLPKNAVDVVDKIIAGKYIPEDDIDNLIKDLPPRQLYKVEIPDDEDLNYLDWDATLTETFGLDEEVLDEQGMTDERIVKADMYERLYDELVSYFDKETALEILQSKTVEEMYNAIAFNIADWDAERKASDLLSRAGFVGIKTGDIYTVFNEDDAQILDRYEYMTDEEGARYRKNVDKGDLDFTYYGSVLVPYTAQELIGRIRDGRPVESNCA